MKISSIHENLTSESSSQIVKKAHMTILNSFKGLPKISWIEFSEVVTKSLNISYEELKEIKYILNERGSVSRNVWEHLLEWFTPLYPSGVPPDLNASKQEIYYFTDILNIMSPSWFFGFMNPIETNKLLINEPTGTFLFRFSSQPGCYTLSVSNRGQVGHWRIKSEKGRDWQYFWIDDRVYNSLQHIIEIHLVEPLHVSIKRTPQMEIRLERPFERVECSENLYSPF
jgi:hypothetical protein